MNTLESILKAHFLDMATAMTLALDYFYKECAGYNVSDP